MNDCGFEIGAARLVPLASGAMLWPDEGLICVSDLHLGRSERVARGAGPLLPPYEVRDTLGRLEADLAASGARVVICLGDSFDDRAAAADPGQEARARIARMQAGRRWIWIAGNHDPGPVPFGGAHLDEIRIGPLTFRHIARPGAEDEISGHYHPKAALRAGGRRVVRRCTMFDRARAILPAYGTYTGGLSWAAPDLRALFGADAGAVLATNPPRRVPLPPITPAGAAGPAPATASW